jgi:hypothetical protein
MALNFGPGDVLARTRGFQLRRPRVHDRGLRYAVRFLKQLIDRRTLYRDDVDRLGPPRRERAAFLPFADV